MLRRLVPFIGIALAVACGIALAPYFWRLAGVTIGLALVVLAFFAMAAVYELIRREWELDRVAPRVPQWFVTFDEWLDPFRAKCPRWFFDWRGVVVLLSPLWITVLAMTVLPFVMQ